MNKPKLSNQDLIKHLKEKGVQFSFTSEEDAAAYISDSTYYYKLVCYKKNFVKNVEGKYVDLDFKCFIELSKLDKRLRYILFKLFIDIEHVLKTKVVKTVCSLSDGYEPVQAFFTANPGSLDALQQNQGRDTSYSHDMYSKYNPDFPIWVFVELASFGTITHFCNFFCSTYGYEIMKSVFLNSVRDLRNAVAHNSCLLRNVSSLGDLKPSGILYSFVSTYGIGKTARRTLTNRFVNDFVSLIYMHKKLIDDSAKFKELKDFFKNDVTSNASLFIKNTNLVRVYHFLSLIVDKI